VDWKNERTGYKDVLETIAKETGMMGFFGIEFFEIETPYRDNRMAGGGVHGNAILTKVKPVSVYRVELPIKFNWENPPAEKAKIARIEKRIGSRFALCADFQAGDSLLTVCSVHLEDKHGGVDGRLEQFKALTKALDKNTNQPHTFVIAGDMNTLDNWLARLFGLSHKKESVQKPRHVSECAWWMKQVIPKTEYRDPFTCKDWTLKKTALYKEKLDWTLVKNAKVVKKGIGDFNSSDHRPLWIEIVPN
jgi:endonuclease/exonuclease/phosphatase family metal-dependent hydrolase